jgi:hypothetical protein
VTRMRNACKTVELGLSVCAVGYRPTAQSRALKRTLWSRQKRDSTPSIMHLIEISIAIGMHVDVSMQREGDMCVVEGRNIDVSIHRTGGRKGGRKGSLLQA